MADIQKWENTIKVGRYLCRLTFTHDAGLASEWDPHLPSGLSKSEWKQYRAGRDALLAEVAKSLGGTVAVVEL